VLIDTSDKGLAGVTPYMSLDAPRAPFRRRRRKSLSAGRRRAHSARPLGATR